MNYMGGLELQRAYLYSIFGLRVPDDGTVTFYREIKLKMGFGVVHCCYYNKIYLQLISQCTTLSLVCFQYFSGVLACYLHRGTCLNAMKRFCICSL